MDTIFMILKIVKVLTLTDKVDLGRREKCVPLSNLSI